jgi:hypothetical protein
MQHRWYELTGTIVAGQYPLKEFVRETDGLAAFSTETADGRPAWVRLLPVTESRAEERYRRWMTAAKLSHPHLLATYGLGQHDADGASYRFIVTEQPDEILGDVLRERPLITEEAHEVAASVLPAVEYLHDSGFTHGDIRPESIFAVGQRAKLDVVSITRAPEHDASAATARDMRQVGATLVEVLRQERPGDVQDPASDPVVAGLPAPFREIAIGCLQPDPGGRWTASRAVQALSRRKESPAPVHFITSETPPAPRKRPMGAMLAVAAILIALVAGSWALMRDDEKPVAAAKPAVAGAVKPSPVVRPQAAEPVAAQTAKPAPEIPRPSPMPGPESARSRTASTTRARSTDNGSSWAVVAAIYRDYDAADRRARDLAERWKSGRPQVFPPEGHGRRYLVVLGMDLGRDAADKLREQAVRSGMPRDTYVTKLSR